MTDRQPTPGDLLVAVPDLLDPNFAFSVVLVIDHDEDGTLGIVLNRPTEVAVADALPDLGAQPTDPAVVFAGGPVAPENALALGHVPISVDEPLWFRRVVGEVGLVDVLALENGDANASSVRIFAGYAGWGPGQLDVELAEGAWIVTPSLPAELVSAEPATLWRIVLRRQPPPHVYLSSWTEDPDSN